MHAPGLREIDAAPEGPEQAGVREAAADRTGHAGDQVAEVQAAPLEVEGQTWDRRVGLGRGAEQGERRHGDAEHD